MTRLFFDHLKIIYLKHRIYSFHVGRRVLYLLRILHVSIQGDIPSNSINTDADSSQDIIVKELCLHLRRNPIICYFVMSFSAE